MKKLLIILSATAATLLAACDQQESTTPATSAPAVEAPAQPVKTADASVYNKSCALCHAAGVSGAPKPGDKEDWAPRIAQGMDVLYQHAIEGFTGDKGMMPPRGGNPALTDDEVKTAVDYMVE